METAHQCPVHAWADGNRHDHDWSNEEFVAEWARKHGEHELRRRALFTKVRALIPKSPAQVFRYLNLGAGVGDLDEMILDCFTAARAVVADGSEPMLAHARQRLERFEGRVECVRADLSQADVLAAVDGPFDVVVSSRAIHHIGGTGRIRALFGEIVSMLTEGGPFINLDYVRLARAETCGRELSGATPSAGWLATTRRPGQPRGGQSSWA